MKKPTINLSYIRKFIKVVDKQKVASDLNQTLTDLMKQQLSNAISTVQAKGKLAEYKRQSYKNLKKNLVGTNRPNLNKSGTFYNDLEVWASDQVYVGVRGKSSDYMAYHNTGTSNMKARKWLPLPSKKEKFSSTIQELIKKYFTDEIYRIIYKYKPK